MPGLCSGSPDCVAGTPFGEMKLLSADDNGPGNSPGDTSTQVEETRLWLEFAYWLRVLEAAMGEGLAGWGWGGRGGKGFT